MTVRAGLLVVGHVDERSRHIAGDYPELFAALLEPVGIEVVPYAADAGQLPDSLDECDGWLCSPSRLSVYDDEPWIADVEDLLRDAIARETPFVGICFGHQLLAQALGGRVVRATDGWGVGVHEYDIVEPLAVMQPARKRFALIASHQDQVVEVPSEARVIATSEFCPVAGLAVGERLWTVQGHPEFVPALADHLLAGRIELIGAERVRAARASLTQPTDHSRRRAMDRDHIRRALRVVSVRPMTTIETDYLVVGAGAAGMAFTDALIANSDADVVMVERRDRPGGPLERRVSVRALASAVGVLRRGVARPRTTTRSTTTVRTPDCTSARPGPRSADTSNGCSTTRCCPRARCATSA